MDKNDTHQSVSYAVALAAANELRDTIEATKVIEHPTEVGRARENVIRNFLASFCPKDFEFGSGFVFDTHGSISRQQDIVVYRDSYHPIFNIGGIGYFPVESVAAVMAVKSSLGSRSVLNDALDSLASVKKLDRTGGSLNYVVADDARALLERQVHEHQIFSAVVTTMSGLYSPIAVEATAQWCESHDRTQWPNWLTSAFDYSIYYDTPGDLPRCNSMFAQGIVSSVINHKESTVPILDFLGQLLRFLWMSPIIDFRPANYLPQSLNYENYRALARGEASPSSGKLQELQIDSSKVQDRDDLDIAWRQENRGRCAYDAC